MGDEKKDEEIQLTLFDVDEEGKVTSTWKDRDGDS